MSDAGVALRILRSYQAIQRLRGEMLAELRVLEGLYDVDGQPDYEKRSVGEYRAVTRHSLNYELIAEESRWNDIYGYRAGEEAAVKRLTKG